MKKILIVVFLFLFPLTSTVAQYVYHPKTSDALKEGTIELFFSNYEVGDVVLIKNKSDSLIRKVILNNSSGLQPEPFKKGIGNLKIYPHKAIDGNPAETVCFNIQGLLNKESENFCLSGVKSMYLLVNIDNPDGAANESGKLVFIFNEASPATYRIDIRHDLACGRKTRVDSIAIGNKKCEISTNGRGYTSNCNFEIKKGEEMSFDITFESNKKGDEKMICLVVVLANLDTGERSSKSIRLRRKTTAHYDIVLKSAK